MGSREGRGSMVQEREREREISQGSAISLFTAQQEVW